MLRSQLKSYNGGDPLWGFVAIVGTERFTGEAVVGPEPRVHLYAADGRIYYAERSGDAPIGQRLVDAGVLTTTELEYGSVNLAGVRSLARLFQRVPSIDRDAVELTVELATEGLLEAVADLPAGVLELHPLRHHPAGIHHWLRSASTVRPPAALLEAGADPVIGEPPAHDVGDDSAAHDPTGAVSGRTPDAGSATSEPEVGEAPWSSPEFGELRFAEPESGEFDAAPEADTEPEPEQHLEQVSAPGADAEGDGRDRVPEPETTQLSVIAPALPGLPGLPELPESPESPELDVATDDVEADADPAQPSMAPLSLAALPTLTGETATAAGSIDEPAWGAAPAASSIGAPPESTPAEIVSVGAEPDPVVRATDSADTGYTPAEPPTPISEPPLVARLAPLPLDSAAALAAIPEADDLPPLSELAYLPSSDVPAASVFTPPASPSPTLVDRPVYEPLANSPTEADLFSPVGGPDQANLPKLATAPIGVEELMAANADDALRASNAAQPHNLAAVEIWELVDHIMDEPQSNSSSNEPTPAGESRERGRRRSKKG